MEQPTRRSFAEQLDGLKQELVKMAAFVESMLDRSVRALADQDVKLAEQVIADDDVADEMDLAIEQQCMHLLALQQPMARDLRTIGTVLKVISDVERMGDYCVDIARAALTLADRPMYTELVDIPRMCRLVADMLRKALQALVREDLTLVQEVIDQDDAVDQIWYAVRDEIIAVMQTRPEVVPQAVHLLMVARYLERIADHTVNVVERVHYMTTGRLEVLGHSHVATALTENHGPQPAG